MICFTNDRLLYSLCIYEANDIVRIENEYGDRHASVYSYYTHLLFETHFMQFSIHWIIGPVVQNW